MDFNLENLTIQELNELKRNYDVVLKKKKEEALNNIIINEKFINKMDNIPNSERLNNYLEKTYINDIDFLFRCLNYTSGNRSLPLDRICILNEQTTNIKNKDELRKRCMTLAGLDDIFKNNRNIYFYEGAYNTFKYIKTYLRKVLIDDDSKSDEELIYKNIDLKTKIVTENLKEIANELLELRNSIPYSRLSIINSSLYKTANKKTGCEITINEQTLIDCIAFGSTLEELEKGNYEEAKQLIYIPHEKIVS